MTSTGSPLRLQVVDDADLALFAHGELLLFGMLLEWREGQGGVRGDTCAC